jgi:hypothetical protein
MGDGRSVLADAFSQAYRVLAGDQFEETKFQGFRDRAFAAPVWITLGMEPGRLPDGALKMPEIEEMMAVACAVQNLHLIASAHGLVGMWHSKGPSIHEVTAKAVGLVSPAKLLGCFFLGYPKVDWPEGERGAWQDKVRWIETVPTPVP